MRISIFGLGYVGVVSMACLARDGHVLVGVDVDSYKLEMIRNGRSPIVEEGIQELTREVVASGRVHVTDDVDMAIRDTELSLVCVGTPASPNGSQDLSAVKRVMGAIGSALSRKSEFHSIVLRSTVQPGTVNDVVKPYLERASGKIADRDFGFAFQPEFLREGSSIRDYDRPPLTIIGTESERTATLLRQIFGHLPCEFVVTSIGVAEMLKYACNAFHAMKITFANEVGRLSQSVGVDGRTVMELVCRDRQLNISTAYLRPGFAFGGSCLPKDLRALSYLAKSRDVTTPMLNAVLGSNRAQIDHALQMVVGAGTRRVGMIGLSFKTGTDDLRESPLVTIAERLIGKGYELRIFDPEVNLSRLVGANKRFIEECIPHIGNLMVSTCAEAVSHGEVVIVGISGNDVLDALRQHLTSQKSVVDLVGIPTAELAVRNYAGICW